MIANQEKQLDVYNFCIKFDEVSKYCLGKYLAHVYVLLSSDQIKYRDTTYKVIQDKHNLNPPTKHLISSSLALFKVVRVRTSRKPSILSHSIPLQAFLYNIYQFDLKPSGPLHPQAWSGISKVAPFADVNMLSGVHTDGFLRPMHDLCCEHFQLYRQFWSLDQIRICFIPLAIAKSCRLSLQILKSELRCRNSEME